MQNGSAPNSPRRQEDGQLSAYERFRAASGCNLVYCPERQRHVMVLPGAVPKPLALNLASALYQRRRRTHSAGAVSHPLQL